MATLDAGRRGHPAFVNGELFRFGHEYRALDYVLEFADVSRPEVGPQAVQRLLTDSAECLPGIPGMASDEILHQYGHVFEPFPQGRHGEWKHVESVEEILAKRSFGQCRGQVTIGRGDHRSEEHTSE